MAVLTSVDTSIRVPPVPEVEQRPAAVSTEVSPPEWDEYVAQHPDATADHLWHWREIFENVFKQRCEYLVARRDGVIVGVLPLVLFRSRLFGRFAVSVPFLNYGGLLASDSVAARALLERAKEAATAFRASHVELRHQQRHLTTPECRDHKVRMVLPLPSTVEALWTRIDRKVRNQVRKAQKEGLTTESGGSDAVEEFYDVFSENMRDLGTPVYPMRLFSEVLRTFPDRARVHLVRHLGRAVAASITIRFRDTELVPWASALRDYRHLCPNMLLYWSMLEGAVADGVRSFDFGRCSRGAGTHHFKQQWGAGEIPLHWEYLLLTRSTAPDQGPSNSKFNLAIAAWQRLPLWCANSLGPHIVRNIP